MIHKRLGRLAELTGVLSGGTDEDRANAMIRQIELMNERMGIPEGFDFIRDEDVEQMITWAMHEANPVYPVPQVFTREHFRQVIEQLRL